MPHSIWPSNFPWLVNRCSIIMTSHWRGNTNYHCKISHSHAKFISMFLCTMTFPWLLTFFSNFHHILWLFQKIYFSRLLGTSPVFINNNVSLTIQHDQITMSRKSPWYGYGRVKTKSMEDGNTKYKWKAIWEVQSILWTSQIAFHLYFVFIIIVYDNDNSHSLDYTWGISV